MSPSPGRENAHTSTAVIDANVERSAAFDVLTDRLAQAECDIPPLSTPLAHERNDSPSTIHTVNNAVALAASVGSPLAVVVSAVRGLAGLVLSSRGVSRGTAYWVSWLGWPVSALASSAMPLVPDDESLPHDRVRRRGESQDAFTARTGIM